MSRLQSIAIVNSLGDYGINTYSFELAEGLAANGVDVDVYTGSASPLSQLPVPSRHRRYAVLGNPLFRQRKDLAASTGSPEPPQESLGRAENAPQSNAPKVRASAIRDKLRERFLSFELAFYLKVRRYDLVWTQWPNVYGSGFWRLCRRLGIRTAHTVHNVLPHEESSEHVQFMRNIYRYCDALIVHSHSSERDLLQVFPESAGRILIAPHGVYTTYPRKADARKKMRGQLGLPDEQTVCLLCGAIRPYKNVDGVLGALADSRCSELILIVAGQEAGYKNSSSNDPLARTRAIARELGVAERVLFIPRFLDTSEIAELLEGSDVLVLPYLKNYGSGLLLLGMTFGKYVVATDVGGAGEYLASYSRRILLNGPEIPNVALGLCQAADMIARNGRNSTPEPLPDLEWPTIARNVLAALTKQFKL